MEAINPVNPRWVSQTAVKEHYENKYSFYVWWGGQILDWSSVFVTCLFSFTILYRKVLETRKVERLRNDPPRSAV